MDIRKALKEAGAGIAGRVPGSPGLEAEILLAHALGVDRSFLFANPELEPAASQLKTFRQLVKRRIDGEPVAYLVGRRSFWSLDLRVTPDVLIPRPETELLVEWALELLPDRPGPRVVDLGTGSGAIALALARERPGWQITGRDLSADALGVAIANGRSNGLRNVRWAQGGWFETEDPQWDLVLSNPPYVRSEDPHMANGDCRFEPREALDGGPDGLRCLREICEGVSAHLAPSGWLLVEHGADQGADVRRLFSSAGLVRVETRSDLAGLERATAGQAADRALA